MKILFFLGFFRGEKWIKESIHRLKYLFTSSLFYVISLLVSIRCDNIVFLIISICMYVAILSEIFRTKRSV